MGEHEDPLLRRTRVEAANAMANSIIDVINAHVRTHGVDDPALCKMLLAALATVVVEINDKVNPEFGEILADMMIDEDFGREEDFD
jgi:uncharacterized membrane protein